MINKQARIGMLDDGGINRDLSAKKELGCHARGWHCEGLVELGNSLEKKG